jgi:hypothetical protein
MSYTLDTNSARKADQGGNRINEIGKYVGKFTQAAEIEAGTKTKGVAFRFESNGQQANLALYTIKADGTKIMGYDTLMAIMTCMQVRQIAPAHGTVIRWDRATNAEVKEQGTVFPELAGKPVGLLLETEEYEKQDGSLGNRMVIAGVFQADTELMASEILDRKTTPELLTKRVAALRHRPVKAKAAKPSGGGVSSHFDDLADDIPF